MLKAVFDFNTEQRKWLITEKCKLVHCDKYANLAFSTLMPVFCFDLLFSFMKPSA